MEQTFGVQLKLLYANDLGIVSVLFYLSSTRLAVSLDKNYTSNNSYVLN